MTIAAPIANSLQRASWIRQMFEAGAQLKQQYGADQVFDFSLGNPILEPPPKVHETLHALLDDPAPGHHRYMPNGGFAAVREYLANELKEEQDLPFVAADVVLCVGAGGGLNVVAKALLEPGDEVVALAPYFVEYGFYVQNHGGVLTVAKTRQEDFLPDLDALEAVMTPKTRAIIVNSPNNPTGVVYSQAVLDELGSWLRTQEQRFGRPIYLIADEPYRKLLFDEVVNGSVLKAHPHSILITSHSKDLGLAGERIGYIALHPEVPDRALWQEALVFTNRILGFVNAPALMQRALPHLRGVQVDIDFYQQLRDQVCGLMEEVGISCVRPQGAFYLFPQALEEDDVAFVRRAQEEKILLVPGSGFGWPGCFRLSYCCPTSVIENSREAWLRLVESYR